GYLVSAAACGPGAALVAASHGAHNAHDALGLGCTNHGKAVDYRDRCGDARKGHAGRDRRWWSLTGRGDTLSFVDRGLCKCPISNRGFSLRSAPVPALKAAGDLPRACTVGGARAPLAVLIGQG